MNAQRLLAQYERIADAPCAWRMFELAMGESAKEPSTKDRKIGIKTKRKLEKAACDGYQRTTNRFLKALNAPFQIKLEPEFDPDPQHGTRCHYSIVLEGKKIPVLFRTVTDERNLIDVPDFSSTLSGGDRRDLEEALPQLPPTDLTIPTTEPCALRAPQQLRELGDDGGDARRQHDDERKLLKRSEQWAICAGPSEALTSFP